MKLPSFIPHLDTLAAQDYPPQLVKGSNNRLYLKYPTSRHGFQHRRCKIIDEHVILTPKVHMSKKARIKLRRATWNHEALALGA